jgi:hypothetical protein
MQVETVCVRPSIFVHTLERTVLRIDPTASGPYAGGMRWDSLFNDLEAQFAEGGNLSMEAEISERARAETAGVSVADRLRGSLGMLVKVHLESGAVFWGVFQSVSPLLSEGALGCLMPCVPWRGIGPS